VVEDAISFLKPMILGAMEDEDNKKKNTRLDDDDDEPEDDDDEDASVPRRLAQVTMTEDDQEDDADDHSYEEHSGEGPNWQQHFDGSSGQHFHFGGQSYHHFANSHHARKIQEMTDALYRGDMQSVLHSFSSNRNSHQSQRPHKRRLEEHQRRSLSKQDQCQLLAECTLHMSMYDTFVYYYSDDIDPAKGEVDHNLLKFDEQDIQKKYDAVQKMAKAIVDKPGSDGDACNSLLEQFHRTIEHGSTPQWEGASVSQVCLAEGSTAFVKFDEIAEALVDNSFPDGYSKFSEEKWVKDVDTTVKMVAEKIAVEAFQCAEELFYKGDRTDDSEEFPFGGCDGKDPSNCGIEKYKFPVKLDVATSETQGKRYETIRTRSKCDRGYEIKSVQQCEKAGLAVNGVLRKGDLQTRNSADAPCGCYIEPKDRAVHWNDAKTCRNKKYHYSIICEERRNRHDFELVYNVKQCDRGFEIKTAEDCEEAGQALGGYLADYRVDTNERDWQPLGCSIDYSNKVLFNPGGRGFKNSKGHFLSVCKRMKRECTTLLKRNECDPGFEIKSENECKKAVMAVNGEKFLRTVDENDRDRPCGCSVDADRGEGYYSKRTSECFNKDYGYHAVCKQRTSPIDEKYKRIQFETQCPAGSQINNHYECIMAGQAMGGFLHKHRIIEASGKDTPCK